MQEWNSENSVHYSCLYEAANKRKYFDIRIKVTSWFKHHTIFSLSLLISINKKSQKQLLFVQLEDISILKSRKFLLE